MSPRKKLLSATLITAGLVTLLLVLYRLFIVPGDLAEGVTPSLGYLVTSVVCIILGSTMWKRIEVPVAEFSLIGGAFCLGLAFQTIGASANVLGTVGLVTFVMGYVILRSAASRGGQRTVFNRIVERQLSPSARALISFPEPLNTESSGDTHGDPGRPQTDREAAIEALRRAC